jgi:hypothetical protein
MQKFVAGLALLGGVLAPSIASAAEDSWDGGYAVKAERRSGFVASVGIGFGVAGGEGYPNDISKIDDPDYRTTADPAFGSMNSIWIGGALRDWFTFGLGLNGFGAKDGDLTTRGSAFILHVEAFPLYNLGGKLRDLAFYTDFGAGGLLIEGGPEKADGGFISYLGAGSSFELWRLGHFALGPTLGGVYTYSQSADAFGAFLGFRGSFYGGP